MSKGAAGDLAPEEKLNEWVEKFGGYRQRPTKQILLEWLGRFSAAHLPIAHKVLDAVIVVPELEIHEGYKDALAGLPGWSRSAVNRHGRWFFVGAGSAGESGPAMLRMFREANGMQNDAWQSFFVSTREIPGLGLTAYDSLVFVDDFAGTGIQMVDYWKNILEELVASEAKCYLLLTAVTSEAAQKIEHETDLAVRSKITLNSQHNMFSDHCEIFSKEERDALDEYGKIAWPTNPRGFGECGLTLVLSHKTPNNSLPILHANNKNWVGPFPRNLIAA